jgi:hypothetical protein
MHRFPTKVTAAINPITIARDGRSEDAAAPRQIISLLINILMFFPSAGLATPDLDLVMLP